MFYCLAPFRIRISTLLAVTIHHLLLKAMQCGSCPQNCDIWRRWSPVSELLSMLP